MEKLPQHGADRRHREEKRCRGRPPGKRKNLLL